MGLSLDPFPIFLKEWFYICKGLFKATITTKKKNMAQKLYLAYKVLLSGLLQTKFANLWPHGVRRGGVDSLPVSPVGMSWKNSLSTFRRAEQKSWGRMLWAQAGLSELFSALTSASETGIKKLTITWKCIRILGLGKYSVVFKLLNSDDIKFSNLMWTFTESADFLGLFTAQALSFCLKPA